jgi:hypothetical protein
VNENGDETRAQVKVYTSYIIIIILSSTLCMMYDTCMHMYIKIIYFVTLTHIICGTGVQYVYR